MAGYFEKICVWHSADEIILDSPAKINLYLRVLGKRPDGYHELENIMHTISLYDRLTIHRVSGGIDFSTDSAEIPTDRRNFVVQAAELFFQHSGISPAVHIHLAKRIPVAAGLGGGSSNAAVALLGLNRLFDNPLSLSELHQIAAGIGSDAPYFLYGGAAVCRGRGEQVEPIKSALKFQGVLLTPPEKVFTAEIYKKFKINLTNQNYTNNIVFHIQHGDYAQVVELCHNSLQDTVFDSVEGLGLWKEVLLQSGCSKVVVCGSGPSLFGFFSVPRVKEIKRRILESVQNKVFVVVVGGETY